MADYSAVIGENIPQGGFVAPGYESVEQAFVEAQKNAAGGAQLCVYRHGEPVIDIWAGIDPVTEQDFSADRLNVIMSCTKAATAICFHMLAERGGIDLQAPIARYWPEFAEHGKGQITVADAMTHRAALPGFPAASAMSPEDMLDQARSADVLAASTPMWEGKAYLYHALTYGNLLAEIFRRVTGETIGTFFAREVAEPLKLDFWLGLPEAQDERVADNFRVRPAANADFYTGAYKMMGVDSEDPFVGWLIENYIRIDEFLYLLNDRKAHRLEHAAANGIATAHAMARMMAACAHEVDGIRLLKPETLATALVPQVDDIAYPAVLTPLHAFRPARFGLGFWLSTLNVPMLGATSFGHPGAGGKLTYSDTATGFSVGYICNAMAWDGTNPDPRWIGWTEALKALA